MRTLLMVAVTMGVSACASGSSSPELAPGSRVATQTVQTGGSITGATGAMGLNMVNDANAVTKVIDGTVEVTWSALQSVYTSLEIPVARLEAAQKTIGNPAFRTRRRVGPLPMIRVVDCGGDSGMPNAETYDVTLDILSRVTTTSDGRSQLQTLVQGTARRATSGNPNDVRCSSLGGLEARIGEMVEKIVAGK